jgi:arylsulfatase A-like enzyme
MDVPMPAIDRLAREGVVFDRATSVAPLTLPAHTSLFTGLFPPGHGVRDNVDKALAAHHPTLAEVLRTNGFRTGAFVGSIVLAPGRGLDRGFDEYTGPGSRSAKPSAVESRGRQRRADSVVTDAVRWLDGVAGSRFFLWAHLYDAHRPYDPPEPYRSAYHDPYVGEIAFADSQIDRLLGALEARRLMKETIVIVAGDHGESLGDHGERDHGIFIYESVLRVPLVIRAPAISPRRVGAVVRLTDVMATVLELVRVPAPPMDGVSLMDLLAGRQKDLELEAYSESEYPWRLGWSPLRALRHGRFKLIDAPRAELYDLERDPFEERNLYDEQRATAESLSRRLDALARQYSPTGHDVSNQAGQVPDHLAERMASLGYVGSARPAALPRSSRGPDPKNCIAFFNARPDQNEAIPRGTLLHCQ